MKNILVVGGTKGIGLEVVRQLKDCNLFITGRSEVLQEDQDSVFIQMDITKPLPDLSVLPDQIDGFVYCPGTINLKPFSKLSEEDFKHDWEVNFYGVVKILQIILTKLKRSDSASVVLFSSVAAGTGMPYHASIASSKAAVEGLTRSLAAELAPKIRVNCIAPSLTLTPLADKLTNTQEKKDAAAQKHPLKRLGSPDDISSAVCFLLSENSSWISGQILHIDGGISSLKI